MKYSMRCLIYDAINNYGASSFYMGKISVGLGLYEKS